MEPTLVTSNRLVIEDTVDGVVRPHGFKRHKRTWIRDTSEIICLLNLDYARSMGRYYFNISLFVRSLMESNTPVHKLREEQGHIRTRAECLLPSFQTMSYQETEISKLLDLESALESAERARRLQTFTEEHVLPFVNRCATARGVRDLYSRNELNFALIRAGVADAFSP